MPRQSVSPRYVLIAALVAAALFVGRISTNRAQEKQVAPHAPRPVYAYLVIHRNPPTIFPAAESRVDPAEFEAYKRSMAAYIASPLLVQAALNDPAVRALGYDKALDALSVDNISDTLIVNFPRGGDIMRVGLSGDRKESATIVNAVLKAFMHEVVERERTEMLDRRDKLQTKLAAYTNELRADRMELWNLERALTPDFPPGLRPEESLVAEAGDLEKQAAETRRAVGELNLRVAKMEAVAKAEEKPLAGATADARAEAKIELELRKQQLAQIVERIEQLREVYTKQHEATGLNQARADLARQQVWNDLTKLSRELTATVQPLNMNLEAPPRIDWPEQARAK